MEDSGKLLGNQILPVKFQPGDVLFRENEMSFHFFIIQEGEVELFKTAPDGKKIPLAVVTDGTSIGEFAMIDRLPRSATAQAITNVRAVRVSDVAYKKLLSELPDWATAVMRAFVERIRHMNEIVRKSYTDPQKTAADVKREFETVEYDPEASTVIRKNPLLPDDDEGDDGDDVPDLA